MSNRYRDDPRYSDGNMGYRDAPPPRWDRETFSRERDDRQRGSTVLERERVYEDYRSPPRRGPEIIEKQRYEEVDRYGPRGNRVEKIYYEEDDYYSDPRAARGAMIPFRERPAPPPPRPGIVRRQSSLDTFDRQPTRRYGGYEDEIRVTKEPERYARPRMEERIYYDDVKVQEPDDGYREYREREWITERRRDPSRSRSRERSVAGTVREEVREEIIEEKPFPRKGITKMPRKIVHIDVLYEMGYPYHEEGTLVIIEKALSKELIDEVIQRSRVRFEERKVEEVTTFRIEGPPEIREEIIEEYKEVTTVPIEEAPRSVREWDALSVRTGTTHKSHKSHRSHRSKSSRRSHSRVSRKSSRRSPSSSSSSSSSRSGTEVEEILERRPSHTTEIIEKKTIIDEGGFDESNSVHVGPLALVVDRRKSRSERDIKEEIRRLEAERRHLRHERLGDRDIVKVERIRERSPSRNRALIIEERGEDVVEVRKDRRGPPPPSPGIIKAMMATLT